MLTFFMRGIQAKAHALPSDNSHINSYLLDQLWLSIQIQAVF